MTGENDCCAGLAAVQGCQCLVRACLGSGSTFIQRFTSGFSGWSKARAGFAVWAQGLSRPDSQRQWPHRSLAGTIGRYRRWLLGSDKPRAQTAQRAQLFVPRHMSYLEQTVCRYGGTALIQHAGHKRGSMCDMLGLLRTDATNGVPERLQGIEGHYPGRNRRRLRRAAGATRTSCLLECAVVAGCWWA